jgi:hypothetical protein
MNSTLSTPATQSSPATRRVAPTIEFLRTGRVSRTALRIVRYVEEDASGNLRLIEQIPLRPVRVA